MKKRRIIGIGCLLIFIVVAISIIYFFNVPIASINGNILNGEQIANECDISIDSANEISISYVSTVNDGNLSIRLLDEDYNIIKEFQSNTEGKEKVSLEAGKYHIRVESDFFIGNYQVKVYN